METSRWRGSKNHSDSTDITVRVVRISHASEIWRMTGTKENHGCMWLRCVGVLIVKMITEGQSMEYKKNTILIELTN